VQEVEVIYKELELFKKVQTEQALAIQDYKTDIIILEFNAHNL